jgi:hypothetical protein
MLDGAVNQAPTLAVFVAYSRKDGEFLEELRSALAVYERSHRLELWADVLVEPGQLWKRDIAGKLARAQIVILLLSNDFLRSSYCMDQELPQALERHRRGECAIVPIVVRWCRYDIHPPLEEIQAIVPLDKPVDNHESRDVAWFEVTRSLDTVIKRLNARPVAAQSMTVREQWSARAPSRGRSHDGSLTQPEKVGRVAPHVSEPPPLLEVLRTLTRARLQRVARKVGAAPRGTKEEIAQAIVESTAGRRTILGRLIVPELRRLCKRLRIASSRTRKDTLIQRLCWRVFIGHRSNVLSVARELKRRLASEEPIFIDAEGPRHDGAFLRHIGDAVDNALVSVIVVSNGINSESILEQIVRAKKQREQRGTPICPVYIDGPPGPEAEDPYGLAPFSPIDGRNLDSAAQGLAAVLAKLPR